METEEREPSKQCECGKMLCSAPGNQSPGGQWACYRHPQFGFAVNESKGPIPAHHQDGTGDCKFDFQPVYLERRKEDWPEGERRCVSCGAQLNFHAIGDSKGQYECSNKPTHEISDRRKSTKCGCGKWKCGGDKHAGEEMEAPICQHIIMGSHHTDGTYVCETNHRSPEAEAVWQEEHTKWQAVRATLPDLAAVLHLLDAQANPLSFDGHDNFTFVENNPEAAAICIHHMYDTLRGIQVGAHAMRKLPHLKSR